MVGADQKKGMRDFENREGILSQAEMEEVLESGTPEEHDSMYRSRAFANTLQALFQSSLRSVLAEVQEREKHSRGEL